jgi:glycosidase
MRSLIFAISLGLCCAANAASFPSPDDWRDENIYFIFTDRFNDGDPANNNAESGSGAPYAPANSRGINGGDFKGIEKKVDYLKSLGATAIWITPIPLNVGGSAYHGYGARDFYALAPHLGTLTDLSNMVSACHSRGIKVMLDIVVNHSGNLINSSDTGYPNFKTPPAGYVMKYGNSAVQHAPPFNITNAVPAAFTSIFHTNGNIQDFNNITQVEKGELSNLDDFNTELTYVRTNMANIYKYWIQAGDLDGFRIDTVKHVDHGNGGFWNYWCPEIHDFATSIGKSNFFMFGEVYDGSDQKCGYYTGTMLSTNFALDSVVDYPLYFMVGSIFASGTGNTKQINDHYNAISTYYDPAAQYRLVTFLDNHDQPRFLNINSSTNRLAIALTFLYTGRGVPCLYYGTEQAFNGGSDPNNREDMFDGQFEQGPSLGDNFNEAHPLFRYVALLNNLRRNYPALRRGGYRNLWNNSSGPGLFAYARTNGNQEVVVVFNTAASAQNMSARPTTYPAGTQLVNLLDTNEVITVDSTPLIPLINVPSFVAKVFVAKSQFLPLDPVVVSVTPAHAVTNVATTTQIVLRFSKPMETNSVQTAFSDKQNGSTNTGEFAWNVLHDTITFTPSASLLTGRTNIVQVGTAALDGVDGNAFFAPFESYFVTASAGSDTTPPSVSISTPGGGTVAGTVNVAGTASDVGGSVAKVEVRLDGGDWAQATGTTSWSFSLDTTKFLNGSHIITAHSTDSAGNISSVDSVLVKFFNAPSAYLARISPGNPSNVTDCAANVWIADRTYALGSFGYSDGNAGILNNAITGACTNAWPLYQRERYSGTTGSFRYLFDCPEGIYETTLLEAETWTNVPNGRVFNAFIEGQQVLTNFDIFATTGGKNIPITLVFTNPVADAQLEILFSSIIDNARASGIQVRKIADLDSDGDGIPDWWMLGYFDHPTGQDGDKSLADQDADGDGMTNLAEFLAGTDPLDPNSAFRITDVSIVGTDLAITWMTRPDKTNQLERSSTLGPGASWDDVGPLTIGTGSPATSTDPGVATNPPAFYRVRLVP